MAKWRTVATHPDLMKGVTPGCSLQSTYRTLVERGLLQRDAHQVKAVQSLSAVLENITVLQRQQLHSEQDGPGLGADVAAAGVSLPQHGGRRGGSAMTLRTLKAHAAAWLRSWAALKDVLWAIWDPSRSSKKAEETALELYHGNTPATMFYEAKASGLYLYGEVGCGKTMMMDMFYHAVPIPFKRRVHLTMFLAEIYPRLHFLTEKKPHGNALQALAEEIAAESRVLCFDEFQVTDIGDAVLLTQLFTQLFRRGVVVVATSNKAPDTLYNINSEFGKFVDLLKKHCVVQQLPLSRDYRSLGTPCPHMYLTPHNDTTSQRLFTVFTSLTDQPLVKALPLAHSGRTITVPYSKGACSLFSFQYLCGDHTAFGPNDYSCVAQAFHTVCIADIPVLGLHNRSEARRFIGLVDELYRYRVKLVCTAACPLGQLFAYDELTAADTSENFDEYYANSTTDREQGRFFIDFAADFGGKHSSGRRAADRPAHDKRFTGEDEVFALRRVQSRMREMLTEEYVRLQHLCFTTQDVRTSLLLTGACA
eukprot:GGOE01037578.1.p1 GENE.GGOE01037578.1~~GGOE01037578.1.p1  ORF type:complete len:560 (+),score=133.55 GGOE01037578.1:77-1681(+)